MSNDPLTKKWHILLVRMFKTNTHIVEYVEMPIFGVLIVLLDYIWGRFKVQYSQIHIQQVYINSSKLLIRAPLHICTHTHTYIHTHIIFYSNALSVQMTWYFNIHKNLYCRKFVGKYSKQRGNANIFINYNWNTTYGKLIILCKIVNNYILHHFFIKDKLLIYN